MKRYVLHKAAEREWVEATAFYEECSPGLGGEFVDSICRALGRIERSPQAFPRYKETRARKCVISRFPFIIFFIELTDSIWIVAIAHARRQPEYWKDRRLDAP